MIDICICTFQRPHIRATLQSVAALTGNLVFRVIVADNDDSPSAKSLVEDTARDFDLNLVYIHAPAHNISTARNACLEKATAPLIAFIDDDELASPSWLVELMIAIENADVALGPVDAIYPRDDWMRLGDFHSTWPVWVKGEIRTGYTCNVLFRRNAPAFAGLRFRQELGRSGGEDTAFFSAAYAKGARIAYAPEAIVTEAVAAERLSFFWLLKRRFRAGQSHALLILDSHEPRLMNIAKASIKALICFFMALVFIIVPIRSRSWLLRCALHVGVVSRLMGKLAVEYYG